MWEPWFLLKTNISVETYLQHLNNVMQPNKTFCTHGSNHRGETVTSLRGGGLQASPPRTMFQVPQIEIGNIMNHRSLAKLALLHKVKPPYWRNFSDSSGGKWGGAFPPLENKKTCVVVTYNIFKSVFSPKMYQLVAALIHAEKFFSNSWRGNIFSNAAAVVSVYASSPPAIQA